MRQLIGLSLTGFSFLVSACALDGGPGDLVASGDAWYRTFGGPEADEGWGLDLTGDGDLLVATREAHPDVLLDAWLYRLDPAGEVVWAGGYAGEASDQPTVVRAGDDAVWVAGSTRLGADLATTDALLLAFDPADGGLLSEATWDGEGGFDEIGGLAVTDAGVFASGWTWDASSDMEGALLAASPSGELLWAVGWGGDDWDDLNGHLVEVDGTLYATGRTGGVAAGTTVTGGRAHLTAFSSGDGAALWSVSFREDGATSEDALGLAGGPDGLYTVGIWIDADPGYYHLVIHAFDLTGKERWATTWDGEGNTIGRALAVDPEDGSLLVAATTDGEGDPAGDMLFLRVSADGEVLDSRTWGGAGLDEVRDVVLQGDMAFANGRTDSTGAGESDGVVLAFNARDWAMPPAP